MFHGTKPARPLLRRRRSIRPSTFAQPAGSPTSALGPAPTHSNWPASLAPDGYVYATEIDLGRLAAIRVAVGEAGLDNVTTLESSGTRTGLPPGCCDGVFLRRVYHHLTDPDAVAADLFAVVRPGGRLAIIDFEPNRWLSLVSSVEGAPDGRNGHGVQPDDVIAELTAAGFVLEAHRDDWGAGNYCLVFVRPET